jgi:26S proteasome regulatory subunit N1
MADSEKQVKPEEETELKVETPEELSQEDWELKDKLELLVERLADSNVADSALEMLRQEVRGATTSMTSVPKPLKFLAPHYDRIKQIYSRTSPGPVKTQLANFISVLATTMAVDDSRETLKFLLEGDQADMVNWGSEYIRNLAGDIRDEW